LLDKSHPPTGGELAQTLGARLPLWERLTTFIAETYAMRGELSFGGQKYGWNLWYRKGGKSLVSLFPQEGYFVAQVVLGKAEVAQAKTLKMGKNVRGVFDSARQFHDGRWLFIKVRTPKDVKDIEQLLLIKRKPARERRTS
jgi:hypothetical protein